MTVTLLKSRAKRLRAALKTTHNVQISHSQALELVAKEDNYPNWDAACAANQQGAEAQQLLPAPAPYDWSTTGKTTSLQSIIDDVASKKSRPLEAHQIGELFLPSQWISAHLRVKTNAKSDLASIFNNQTEQLARVRKLSNSFRGALIVVGGTTMSGKTTTMHSIVADIASRRTEPFYVYHLGIQEQAYPDNVHVAHCDNLQKILRSRIASTSLIIMDEIRNLEMASMATTMALLGMTVICTVHSGTSPRERLSALTQIHDRGEGIARLVENDIFFEIQQEIEWEGPEIRERAAEDRWRAMLRRKGFIREDRIDELVKQGAAVVYSALRVAEGIQTPECNVNIRIE
ncbi:ATPase, T2SS/T4P/T4SS family [Pseudomonas syringae pv. actinidiae]|nr:ATPase, T2SS/T4P/T4SS family [Pseudomonas syringae pv. actinidiae]